MVFIIQPAAAQINVGILGGLNLISCDIELCYPFTPANPIDLNKNERIKSLEKTEAIMQPDVTHLIAVQPILGFHRPDFNLASYGDLSETDLIYGVRLHTNLSKHFALSLSWLHSTAKAEDKDFIGDREKFLQENMQPHLIPHTMTENTREGQQLEFGDELIFFNGFGASDK